MGILESLTWLYTIKTLLVIGAAGAFAGLAAYYVGKLTGPLGAVLVGAMVLVGADYVVEFDKSKGLVSAVKLAEANARIKALEFERQALEKITEAQKAIELEADKRLKENEQTIERLDKLLEDREDMCGAGEDVLDELRKIK